MNFSTANFLSKCDHVNFFSKFPVDLVTFTEETLTGKLHLLYTEIYVFQLAKKTKKENCLQNTKRKKC